MRLSVPAEGIRGHSVVLRFPSLDDVDGFLPAFTDAELREAGNLPAFDRDGLVASIDELPSLAAMGRLLALAAVDAVTGEIIGGGTLHHLDAERGIVEIGYFVLPARETPRSRDDNRPDAGRARVFAWASTALPPT